MAATSIAARFGSQRRHCGLAIMLVAAMIVVAPYQRSREHLPTPLETAEYSRLSTSAEISAYLERLARAYPQARVETFGTTAQGRPLQALLLTSVAGADVSTPDRLTISIVGSQHGTEIAGAESLQFIARDLLSGTLRPVLDDADIVLVPNANPDGRELGKRANANRVNLNTDFVALSQPESRSLVAALQRYRPEVVLDVHESAVLKRKSLAREGYMTNFMAQFEIGNNPNIVPGLRRFALAELLKPWIAAVNAAGLRSHRYIGEIRSSRQPVTNGGLTLHNLRNRIGMEGTLSFLMETRLDPRNSAYPTFRNIKARVERQRISIDRFLTLVHDKHSRVLAAVAVARAQAASAPLVLDACYTPAVGNPQVTIELRRIADGELQSIEFPDHRMIAVGAPLPMPKAYLVRAHQPELGGLLDRHGIVYRVLDAARTDWAIEFAAAPAAATADAALDGVRERAVRVRAHAGDLWIDLNQPRGRLAALLLEPRSTSSLLRTAGYLPLVAAGKVLPIFRIP
jgi:hypothetical protein